MTEDRSKTTAIQTKNKMHKHFYIVKGPPIEPNQALPFAQNEKDPRLNSDQLPAKNDLSLKNNPSTDDNMSQTFRKEKQKCTLIDALEIFTENLEKEIAGLMKL